MSTETEVRRDWRVGVLMADGTTSFEVIRDQTERRALREAIDLAAHYRGRDGANPPVRIVSVHTFEELSPRSGQP